MSRTSQAAAEAIETEVEETKPTITAETKAIAEKVVEKPVESVANKVAIEPNKKIGIVRYLQLHPTGNKTLDRTLTKLFGSEVHTEAEWEKIINDFLNS